MQPRWRITAPKNREHVKGKMDLKMQFQPKTKKKLKTTCQNAWKFCSLCILILTPCLISLSRQYKFIHMYFSILTVLFLKASKYGLRKLWSPCNHFLEKPLGKSLSSVMSQDCHLVVATSELQIQIPIFNKAFGQVAVNSNNLSA